MKFLRIQGFKSKFISIVKHHVLTAECWLHFRLPKFFHNICLKTQDHSISSVHTPTAFCNLNYDNNHILLSALIFSTEGSGTRRISNDSKFWMEASSRITPPPLPKCFCSDDICSNHWVMSLTDIKSPTWRCRKKQIRGVASLDWWCHGEADVWYFLLLPHFWNPLGDDRSCSCCAHSDCGTTLVN